MFKTIKRLFFILLIAAICYMMITYSQAGQYTDTYNSTYSVSVTSEVENQIMDRFADIRNKKLSLVQLSDVSTSDDANNLFLAFRYDYPRESFLYTAKLNQYFVGNKYYGLVFENKYDFDNYSQMLEEIDAELNNISLRIDTNWSNLQKVLWVNDYICDVYEYDYTLTSDDLYSMVHYRQGTCQGYTKLFKAVMDKLGIECSFAVSHQIEHVWNIVKIDGEWYHIDVTWNDHVNKKGMILLTNDATSYKAHGEYYGLPSVNDVLQKYACSSNKYSDYFWVNGLASGFAMSENNTAYGFDLAGNFNKYNLNNNTYETKFTISNKKWPNSSGEQSKYYFDYFGDVISMGDIIYYSTPRQVFLYDSFNDKSTLVFETNEIYIYAILFDGKDVYLVDFNYDLNAQPIHVSIYKTNIPLPTSKYTVKWVNYDDTVLETDAHVLFGATPSYDGQTPTKPSTTESDYVFTGWTPSISSVTGDITYKATFSEVKKKHTIQWKDYDGTVLKSEQVEHRTTPSYGENPTRPSDNQYQYTFAGWSPEVSAATEDKTYTATYNQTKITYTVTWKDYNGNVLEQDAGLEYGAIPKYDGSLPTRAADAQHTYTFKGWSPEVSSVTKNIEYVATYTMVKNTYTITWKNWDGSVLKVDTLEYGTTPVYSGEAPSRASDSKYDYKFKGWSPDISSVSKNFMYTAVFTATKKQDVTSDATTTVESVETTEATETTTTEIITTTEEKITTVETTESQTTESEITTKETVETSSEVVTETITEMEQIETTETTEITETTDNSPVETTPEESAEITTTSDYETSIETSDKAPQTESITIEESVNTVDTNSEVTESKQDVTTTAKEVQTTSDSKKEPESTNMVVIIAIVSVVVLGIAAVVIIVVAKKKK